MKFSQTNDLACNSDSAYAQHRHAIKFLIDILFDSVIVARTQFYTLQ